MLNHTCTMIICAEFARYGVSRAKIFVSGDCGTSHFLYFPKGEHLVAALSVRPTIRPSVRHTFIWSISLKVKGI